MPLGSTVVVVEGEGGSAEGELSRRLGQVLDIPWNLGRDPLPCVRMCVCECGCECVYEYVCICECVYVCAWGADTWAAWAPGCCLEPLWSLPFLSSFWMSFRPQFRGDIPGCPSAQRRWALVSASRCSRLAPSPGDGAEEREGLGLLCALWCPWL